MDRDGFELRLSLGSKYAALLDSKYWYFMCDAATLGTVTGVVTGSATTARLFLHVKGVQKSQSDERQLTIMR